MGNERRNTEVEVQATHCPLDLIYEIILNIEAVVHVCMAVFVSVCM